MPDWSLKRLLDNLQINLKERYKINPCVKMWDPPSRNVLNAWFLPTYLVATVAAVLQDERVDDPGYLARTDPYAEVNRSAPLASTLQYNASRDGL